MADVTEKPSVLVVDDEDLIRRSIRKKLTKEGYDCSEASCGEEALGHLTQVTTDLVILDIMMPGKSGKQLLPEIKDNWPDTAVIMATAVNDPKTIVDCMKNGAVDYLPKPFELDELMLAVGNALVKRRLELELKVHTERFKQTLVDQGKQIRKLTLASFESLVNALEAKDRYTAGHSRRVAKGAEVIGRRLDLSVGDMENLWWGALLHDVGKIAVDPAIQNKPDKLTLEEYRHLMIHAQIGPSIVAPVANQKILDIIRHHHDYYNGTGFDQTIKGEDIPVEARIVAVADAFDAMTSDRPYSSRLSPETAAAEINSCAGAQFDPVVVNTFLRSIVEIVSAQVR